MGLWIVFILQRRQRNFHDSTNWVQFKKFELVRKIVIFSLQMSKQKKIVQNHTTTLHKKLSILAKMMAMAVQIISWARHGAHCYQLHSNVSSSRWHDHVHDIKFSTKSQSAAIDPGSRHTRHAIPAPWKKNIPQDRHESFLVS